MREIVAAVVVMATLGCSSGGANNASGPSDATSDVTQTAFGNSACGGCLASACSTATGVCNAAPDCAAYLSCLNRCPLAANGNAEAMCASSCPQPTSTAGGRAASQLAQCFTAGAGASCSSCGSDTGSPDAGADGDILHEHCAPDEDAANPCAKCIREECCGTRLACLNDLNCLTLLNCESDCLAGLPDDAGATAQPPDGGSYSCDLWCGAAKNPSLDKWAQVYACTAILCQGASQCNTGDMCTMCLSQFCVTEDLALSANPDGYLFESCFGQCATADTVCQTTCQTAYPGVAAALSSWILCMQQHCSGC